MFLGVFGSFVVGLNEESFDFGQRFFNFRFRIFIIIEGELIGLRGLLLGFTGFGKFKADKLVFFPNNLEFRLLLKLGLENSTIWIPSSRLGAVGTYPPAAKNYSF